MINGDAFSDEVKQRDARAAQAAAGAQAGLRRLQPGGAQAHRREAGVTYSSALKPIGAPFRSKSINLGNEQVSEVEIAPATDAEIEATRKVMGGEDFAAWVHALLDADLLAPGCRAVAYSYIGPELTYPIYRSGTIGKAKEDLERRPRALSATLARARRRRRLRQRQQGAGHAGVGGDSGRAALHQPLYRVMKEAGTHEGTAEQIARLFRDHLGARPHAARPTPRAASASTIWRCDPAVQARVTELWEPGDDREPDVALTDYAGFKRDFRVLFGFEVPGVDYDAAGRNRRRRSRGVESA